MQCQLNKVLLGDQKCEILNCTNKWIICKVNTNLDNNNKKQYENRKKLSVTLNGYLGMIQKSKILKYLD